MTTTIAGTLRHHRTVFTWIPEQWPEGCITGIPTPDGGLDIEHVIVFRTGTLARLIGAGLDAVRAEGYSYLTFSLPETFPPGPALERMAWRAGFVRYATEGGQHEWVRWL